MEPIDEASTAAYLSPRERMQMMKENLMKDEARERNKPWEQSRITRKNSQFLGVSIPTSRDRPPPASGILRRTSATSSVAGSDYSLSPCPSPYSQHSDFGPPPLERRSSKVRFSSEPEYSSAPPSLKRQSSVQALRADLERAKASLSGAVRATLEELEQVDFSLRRLSAEEFDEAFKPQPLRLPRMSRTLSSMSSNSSGSDSAPARPPKSPLRHSISAASVMSSISGPSRSVSVSTAPSLGSSASSFSSGSLRGLSISTVSTASSLFSSLPAGPSYQSLLPRDLDNSVASSSPRTPTLNRGGWSGDIEVSPRSTPQVDLPVDTLPDPPVQSVEASPATSMRSQDSDWSLTNLDFPVPPPRVYVFPQFPSVTAQSHSDGESATIEETESASNSPAFPVLELVEELERRKSLKSTQVAEAVATAPEAALSESSNIELPLETPALEIQRDDPLSPDESPLVTPNDESPISASRNGSEIDIYAVPLSFTTYKEDPLSMTLLEAAVDCEIVSPNSSLLKPQAKVPSRLITVKLDEDDDGWMGSDAEEEEYYKAIRRIATTRRHSSADDARLSRISQMSSTSISSASTMEILTPLPSSDNLPFHGSLPTRFASSPSSPTPASKASLGSVRRKTFEFKKMPKPGLDIEWGPPEVLYDAMDWVWRPQAESLEDSRVTPRASRSEPSPDDEDLRGITFEEVTPRPVAFDRVPTPPLRMPEGVEEWLLEETMPTMEHAQVGMAF